MSYALISMEGEGTRRCTLSFFCLCLTATEAQRCLKNNFKQNHVTLKAETVYLNGRFYFHLKYLGHSAAYQVHFYCQHFTGFG